MNKKVLLIIPIFICVLLLVGCEKKEQDKQTKEENKTYKIIKNQKESIQLEGMEEIVTYNKLVSDKGFSLKYDPEYFTLDESSPEFMFKNEGNELIYLKIEVISKDDYKKLKEEEEKNDYLITRYYRNSNDLYILITTSVPNKFEYLEGMYIRLDDMARSLEFDK